MKSLISLDETKPTNTNNTRHCNCRQPDQCPIQGNCLKIYTIYKAEVATTDNNEMQTYIGVTAYCSESLNNKKYHNNTELYKHIWQLEDTT